MAHVQGVSRRVSARERGGHGVVDGMKCAASQSH